MLSTFLLPSVVDTGNLLPSEATHTRTNPITNPHINCKVTYAEGVLHKGQVQGLYLPLLRPGKSGALTAFGTGKPSLTRHSYFPPDRMWYIAAA